MLHSKGKLSWMIKVMAIYSADFRGIKIENPQESSGLQGSFGMGG